MPSNKINYKVKCLHTGCNSNKIRKDKINLHYKTRHPNSHVKFEEIDSPLDTLKINLPQPIHNIITLNQDEEQSHLDAPYPEIIPFLDDETWKIENMPRSSNLDNPEKISGNLSTIKEGKNDDIDMQALESIYIDKVITLSYLYILNYTVTKQS
ncbi:unnamed protein product [Gordionus sp. m RMFG-2023]